MAKSKNLIVGGVSYISQYTDFSIQCFTSFDEYWAYGELAKSKAVNKEQLEELLAKRASQIDEDLRNNQNTPHYGMFGKQPRSYQEAINRTEFVYQKEYEEIKKTVREDVIKKLQKSSIAKAMESKLIFNERQLGEFVFTRAAAGLTPKVYFYSEIHKREYPFNELTLKEDAEGKTTYYLIADGTEVIRCIRITKTYVNETGETVPKLLGKNAAGEDEYEYEFFPLDENTPFAEILEKGILSAESSVKKVYQYKDKQPRIRKAVKLLVAYTYGSFTGWDNDFYTGITAVMVAEFLEGLGYAVQIEVIIGGGKCGKGCPRDMNTPSHFGRRFVSMTAKKFDAPLELFKLLYWMSDPSALYVKQLQTMNIFNAIYGDGLGFQEDFWHGIEAADLINPLGTYFRFRDIKDGNKDLMYYKVHRVANAAGVMEAILDIVLTSENINLKINKMIASV